MGSTSGGTGELTISNGGSVTGADSVIGSVAGSTGIVTVDGVGSALMTYSMIVGKGMLLITGGGSAITGNDSGGGTSIGIGSTVTVEGAGSSLTYGYGGLQINGDLSITDGGQVTSPNNRGTANVNSGATLTVDGTDSMLTSGNFNVGAGGLMAVTRGGNVVTTGSSGDVINGTVTVDGAGSEWTNNGNFFMGNTAGTSPTIAITNGGAVILAPGGQMMANNATSSALITVDGAGSRLNTGGTFSMQGVNPTDPTTIQVTNGGALNSNAINIGRFLGDIARITVDGDGSTWTTTAATNIGLQGSGTATLTNGAVMTSGGGITVGAQKGSTGTFDISGGASVNAINASGTLQSLNVGGGGTGTLNIHEGSSVTAGATSIGVGYYTDTGTGFLTVDGTDAVLNTTSFAVGSSLWNYDIPNTGTLTIANGGEVNSTGTGLLGNRVSSTGTVDISSDGRWNLANASGVAQNLTVGNSGTGTLNIDTTGTVTAGNTVIGSGATGVGTVKVDGTDASLSTAQLTVGNAGQGTLNITDNGVVNSVSYGVVGGAVNSNGEVNVSSDGQWNLINAGGVAQGLTVGNSGTGTLNINTTGNVTAGSVSIGSAVTGVGTANIDGTDALLNTAAITVGASGQGTLTITDGGVVNSTGGGILGNVAGSTGDVDVSTGGQWNLINDSGVGQNLFVGGSGEGTLNIHADSSVTAGTTNIGFYLPSFGPGGTGTVTVDGAGAVLNTTAMTIGYVGEGTLAITNNGVVNSSGAGTVAANAGSTGTVDVSSNSEWNLVNTVTGAVQNLNVGNNGAGTLNINTTGTVTAGNTIIGSGATGVGTVKVDGVDALLNAAAMTVGYAGKGTVTLTDDAMLQSLTASLGSAAGSDGTVNVSSGAQWNIGDTSQYTLTIGDAGTGTLNINTGGRVSGGLAPITLGNAATGNGTLNVDGTGSLLRSPVVYLGMAGSGILTLSNGGTLETENPVELAMQAGSSGTFNIGAAHGESAAGAGFITGADSVNMGAGTGTLVFNHTVTDPTTAGGYQFTPLITGNGTVMQDAGHTVLNTENTYSGTTQINGGTLTTTSQSTTGNTGLGTSAVNIAAPGTLDVAGATTDGTGNFTFSNLLTGNGLLSVDLASAADTFDFAPSAGTAFAGVADLKNSTFALSGDNAAALTDAMLMTSTGNTTTVSDGVQQTDGLAFNGGTLALDITLPGAAQSDGVLQTGTLVAGAGTFSRNGRDFQASGTGNVQVTLTDPWNDPGLMADPDTRLNLLQQDDTRADIQLIQADTVTGSGGSLMLTDQNGDVIGTDETVAIAQNGTVVADGLYGIRMTTAPGDGLYINYGLKEVDIHAGQTLTLAEFAGATGADADMSAKVSGSGNLAVNTTGLVSLSNGLNDYSGATQVQAGTLRTDADGALGNTRELNISSNAITDLNGTVQTVGMLTGQADSILNVNGGTLTLQNGGLSDGSLTGAGNLNIDGGVLTINGTNSDLSVATTISSGAQVSINDVQGAGSGDITDDGTLTLDGVTGTFANNVSGTGNVDATNTTDITLTGDNSGFSGLFTIDSGSTLTVSEQKNLGTAAVSGAGNLTKTGSGVLTLAQNSAAWTGTTEILGGEIALGDKTTSPVDMASQLVNIHDGATLSGYGSTAGDINVMQGGTLQVDFTVGGNLNNSGQVLLNRPGMQPGNSLTVNGNYTGNDGLMTFNTALGGDDSSTDKLTVHGDTTGNTRVEVNNVGGTGAQTVNGIEMIQVGGDSAGNFALTTGTVEAGAYVYTLAKGTGDAAKNWYLTSKWTGSVTPPDDPVPPVDPVKPPVVDPTAPDALRPEAGSYISNIAAANTLFNHRLHDRLGEPQYTDNATSMWMRHAGGHERSSAGDGQLKTQSNRYVLQLGGDIAQWSTDGLDRWHLGVMGGYANEHSNTRNDRAGYGSDGRVSGYSAGLYGTWYQNDADKTGAYVDSWMLYNWFDNHVESEHRESDSYHSKGLTASLEAGYTLKAGEFTGSQGTLNTWYIQPQAQVTWMGVKDDAHTRNDGTRIETEGDGNIQTRLGVRTYLNSHHKMDDGKQREFQPFVEVNWIHNTEAFGVKMDGTRVSRDGARNLGEIRTGVEGKLNDRLSVWGNVGVQMGDKGYSNTQGMLGVKYSW
ncbi:autotransporter outer membrane beta-barrel domain-containing protein [Trabulsiella odontotermitis]|uniref:autotransporter outer membrane beta-barrel domain-containing protein n=6 Tax=Trabulsiella odontotermitis TaxID=379893 RepID=UPI001F437355|nr:autotransporter outer membrane beta-barrel domain-containing protein [Trabulsiella odontotermitis]